MKTLAKLSIKQKRLLIAAVTTVVVAVVAVIAINIYIDRYLAVTMRLQRLVGDVALFDDSGNELTLKEKMRLASGQSVNTAGESLIMVSLDDTKLLTMEESSQAEIRTKRKQLEFHLLEGNLFFNVTEKLADNESFDVVTSTMVCGIRGTSAYVGRDSTSHEILMCTDGIIHVVATNPVTKEFIETDVYPGEMITIYLDEEAEGGATISIRKTKFREEDLPALALDTIAKSDDLRRRIAQACNFDPERLDALAEVSTVSGVSMYGEAADEFSTTGKEDRIPLMGYHAHEMVNAANSAYDIALDDLPLEIAILKGLRDVLDVGIEAQYQPVPLSDLMEGAEESMREIYSNIDGEEIHHDDLITVVNVVSDTLAHSASEMTSSNLTSTEVAEVFRATTQLFVEAINSAKEDPSGIALPSGDGGSLVSATGSPAANAILGAVANVGDYVTGTVNAEMIKSSNGEETVIALLGRPMPSSGSLQGDDIGTAVGDAGQAGAENGNQNPAGGNNNGNDANDNGNAGDNGGADGNGNNVNGNNDNAGANGGVGITDPSGGESTGSDNGNTSASSGSSSGTSSGTTSGTASGTNSNTTTATIHSVTFNLPADVTIVSGNITSYTEGVGATLTTNVTKTPTIDTQYTFEGWYTEQTGGTKVTTIPSSATEDYSLYPRFTSSVRKYSITLSTDGGTVNAGNLTEYSYGTIVNLPTNVTKAPDNNYTYSFAGWFDAATGGNQVTSITASDNGNKTFYAHWNTTVRLFDITINSATGGTATARVGNNPATQAVYGATVFLDATPSGGYRFDGWTVVQTNVSLANASSASTSFSMIAGPVQITPRFVIDSNTITASCGSRGTMFIKEGNSTVTSAVTGHTITVEVHADAGYQLSALTVAGSSGPVSVSPAVSASTDTYTFTMPSEAVTVTSVFALRPISGTLGITGTAEVGQTLTAAVTYANGEVQNHGTLSYAWKRGSGSSATAISGANSSTYTLASADANKYITCVVTSSVETGSLTATTSSTVVDNSAPAYSITVNNTNTSQGTVSCGYSTSAANEEITFSVRPVQGYDVDTVTVTSGTGNSPVSFTRTGNNYYFTMPSEAVTISATFAVKNYSIANGTITHGSVTSSVTSAAQGTTVTLTTTPDNGYRLKNLYVRDSQNNLGSITPSVSASVSSYSFTMPYSDVTVSAVFEAVPISGTVTITGTAEVGHDLIANVSGTIYGNTYYRWYRKYSDGTKEDTYAISANYGLQEVDLGCTMICEVTSDIETGKLTSAESSRVTGATYNITIASCTGGSISCYNSSAAAGSSVYIDVRSDNGYDVDSVTYVKAGETTSHDADELFYDAAYITMPASDITVYAVFSPNEIGGILSLEVLNNYDGTYDVVANLSTEQGMGNGQSFVGSQIFEFFRVDGSTVTSVQGPSSDGSYTTTSDDIGKVIRCRVTSSIETGALTATSEVIGGGGYSISVADTVTNGTVSVPATAQAGDTVEITAAPDTGYIVYSVSYKTAGSTTFTRITPTNGRYTFTMPSSNVVVTASFDHPSAVITKEAYVYDDDANNYVRFGSTSFMRVYRVVNGNSYVVSPGSGAYVGDTIRVVINETTLNENSSEELSVSDITVYYGTPFVTVDNVTQSGNEYTFTMPDTGSDTLYIAATVSAVPTYSISPAFQRTTQASVPDPSNSPTPFSEFPCGFVDGIDISFTVNGVECDRVKAGETVRITCSSTEYTIHGFAVGKPGSDGGGKGVPTPAVVYPLSANNEFTMPNDYVFVYVAYTGTGYPVDCFDALGGTITATPATSQYANNVAEGEIVTISSDPDEGFRLASITVTDESGNDIASSPVTAGQATFTMPASGVTVEPVFVVAGTNATITLDQPDDDDVYEMLADPNLSNLIVTSDTDYDLYFYNELTIPSGKTLEIGSNVAAHENNGTLTNNGTLIIDNGAYLTSNDFVENNGIIINNGTFTSRGAPMNNGGIIYNHGTFTNNGTYEQEIYNSFGHDYWAYFVNYGTVDGINASGVTNTSGIEYHSHTEEFIGYSPTDAEWSLTYGRILTVNFTDQSSSYRWCKSGYSTMNNPSDRYRYLTVEATVTGGSSIPSEAFKWNTNLETIHIPSSITVIEEKAFYGCDSLTDVYFDGTRAQWDAITIGSDNTELTSATIHCSD